jgi:hypothetical protein
MNLSLGQVPKGRLLLDCELSPRRHRYSNPSAWTARSAAPLQAAGDGHGGERINIAAL